MSNAKTGLWSAVGALFGGVVGAYAGKVVAEHAPRKYYGGTNVADAMATGAAAGAVVGAFAAGTMAGEPTVHPQLPAK
jgi:hypothetical protein